MSRYLTSILILAGLFLLLPADSYPASSAKDAGLQKACEKMCEAWFQSYLVGHPALKKNYRCHYSKKLNKCFARARFVDGLETHVLCDVSENRIYGDCSRIVGEDVYFPCTFLGKDIPSKEEWDALVKPYMEE